MKKILLQLVFTCCCSFAICAQSADDFMSRVESGDLTLEECSALIDSGYNVTPMVPSLLKLKKQIVETTPFDETGYFFTVFYLQAHYLSIGNYESDRALLSEAIGIFDKLKPDPNDEFRAALNNQRGLLEFKLKNYSNAMSYFAPALAAYENTNNFGAEYMVVLINMASTFSAQGDTLSAKIFMDEAVDRYEQLYGSIFNITDGRQFQLLNDYGFICLAVGHYQEAEKCFLTVIHNSRHTSYSIEAFLLAVNNLSTIYMKQGRWDEGAQLLQGIRGENDQYNYQFAQNRSLCNLYAKNYPEAVAALQETDSLSMNNVTNIFSHFTGLERENYWTQVSREMVFYNNLVACHTGLPQAAELAYDNALFCKNVLVNSAQLLEQFVKRSNNPMVQQQYRDYLALKNQLAYKSSNADERDSLASKIEETERSVLASYGNLGQWLKNDAKTWRDVQASLAADEIAVEFCYAPRMEHFPDLQPYYGAFILRKDSEHPQLVMLENVDTVDFASDIDNGNAFSINELYSSAKASKLYAMLWSKLTPYLRGIRTIYYAPTGYLSNINFEVLPDEHGMMMNDKYTMVRVSSTANIAAIKAEAGFKPQSSALYGNIKYDATTAEMAQASDDYKQFTGMQQNTAMLLRSANERGNWGAIPSTKMEIDSIAQILSSRGVQVSKFQGTAACEEAFKSLDGHAPSILHLATHGFVYDTGTKVQTNKFTASTSILSPKESYMMWAGLVMAGGNNTWQGHFNLSNVEDGILTADEISQLDLSNTRLVVLSACETARGRIDPIDGVFGLQRAFKMAGAGTIVMSLWKVQDDATCMLMSHFYSYLAAGTERHQALWKAMMDVKAVFHDPYYWAGFIMLD